ncbi:lipopolysaccharide-binding protein [Tamandua tetradactyla]|uniref:lipopolysaccharide-binding protein n=1 Tax=Tamandua tetradactyla TaxID=48850 RepID=UPI0040540A1D
MSGFSAVLAPLLLGVLLASAPGTQGANPGLVGRITDKGLEYAAGVGLLALQRELRRISMPTFTGDFNIKLIGRGRYEFHSLEIHTCELQGAALRPLPGQGLSLSISDYLIGVQGRWKVRKSFLRLKGSIDLRVKGVISVNLLLGSEPSGRPTATMSNCSSHIHNVDLDVSGDLGWLTKLFQNQIESRFQKVLNSKVCEMIQKSVTSDLQPYLQTLPVTAKIDSVAGIDYSLTGAPQATAQMLDVMFKGEIFNLNLRSPVTLLAPVLNLPEEHSRMVYFAVSDYVFNTASLVYHEAGYLNFSVTDDMIPPNFHIRLTTKFFRTFIPGIVRKYPNMNLELHGTVVPTPFLTFNPGNLSLTLKMEIEAFVLQPDSLKELVFRLGVATDVSPMLTFNASKITGSLHPGRLQLKLKESKLGVFNVALLEALINYYTVNTLYPRVNEKLAEGYPLPLLKDTQLYDLVLQIHKDFLLVGANVQYTRV